MATNQQAVSEDAAGGPIVVRPRLLRIADVARLLGVSTDTVAKLHSAAAMPAPIRLCRALLWDVEELNAWISYARKNGGAPPVRKEWAAIRDMLMRPGRN